MLSSKKPYPKSRRKKGPFAARKKPQTDAGDRFFSHLPPNTGFLANLILKFLFLRIKIDPSLYVRLPALKEDGIVVFVNKYKSIFEYFLFHTRFRHEGLPYPSIGCDYQIFLWQPVLRFFKGIFINIKYFLKNFSLPDPYRRHYIRQQLMNGETALLSLIEEKGFYRRLVESKTDPIDYLIEMQKTIDRPIYLVPMVILFDKTPQNTRLSAIDLIFGTKERPGRLRRLFMLMKSPGKILIEASEPVSMKSFLEKTEVQDLSQKNQVSRLRRDLLEQINRHRQSITGPAIKSRDEIMEEVLTAPALQKSVAAYAKENKISLYKAQKEAAGYLDEIAANYSLKVIRLYEIILRWVFRSIFDGMVIDYDGLNRVKQMSKKGPLVLVPCHKSHLDYLLISYVFFTNNMPCPHIAAGKNLSFWPLGPLFRGGGAFFIRRTFKGEALYPKVFAAYLNKILDVGFHIEFFIEGGRSRTGKLLTPKIGFLSLLMDAYQQGNWKDMIFVPIYIGYDRVLEEKAYVSEVEGGKKNPENISNVIKARKSLKKKYGKIYINFHEPFSLADFLTQHEDTKSAADPALAKKTNALFGYKIIGAINEVSVVTPHAIIASAILNCAQKRFFYKQLLEHAETYMNHLLSKEARLTDTLFIDRQSAFDSVIEIFAASKFIEHGSSDPNVPLSQNPIFKINESRRSNLEYYKNNGIIFFITGAFTSLSILATDAFQFSTDQLHENYVFLKDLFENEFIFTPEDSDEMAIRKNLKAFINDAIITPHPTLPDTYNLTSAGYRKLNLFAAFLTPYFESYWVVLNFFMRYAGQSIFDSKDHIKKIQALGNRMYKRYDISRKEALSKINYTNAVTYFTNHGLVNPESDKEKLDYFVKKFEQYRRFLAG